jgi:glutathione S-transferase
MPPEAPMLTFYYATNTCALASHIALEEAGAAYDTRWVDFGAAEQAKPEYLEINPKARVPSLATERGVLTETPAILAYIAQTHPQAQLAPLDDPFAFAEMQSFITYLCSTVHVAHAHRPRAYRWADDPAAQEAMKKKVPETVGACFDLIERKMFKGPWAMGEVYTVADPYLFTIARWLEGDGVDPAAFPRVLDHRDRMAERPAVQRVLKAEGLA